MCIHTGVHACGHVPEFVMRQVLIVGFLSKYRSLYDFSLLGTVMYARSHVCF